MTNTEQNHHSINTSAMQAEFEALDIPVNINPRLLELWIEREQDLIEQERQQRYPKAKPKKHGRSLARLFPAYIGIAVMCLAIILGLVQGKEPGAILQMACVAFLVYTIAGFFVGMVMEWCVSDSVETLLRDIVQRSQVSAQASETSADVEG